jgi:hypothetical protein
MRYESITFLTLLKSGTIRAVRLENTRRKGPHVGRASGELNAKILVTSVAIVPDVHFSQHWG